jgi:hypothetical protein
MLRLRYGMGLGVATVATAVLACQPIPTSGTGSGGELTMQVRWPMRTQAIPPLTAVVAVGVFRDGSLVSKGSFRVGIVGRGAGSILYGGLPNGEYRVVAGAFDKDARALAGGVGTGTINIQAGPRTQVQLALQPGDPAAELNPFLPDIQRYLASLPEAQQTPSPLPTVSPPPTTDPNTANTPSSTPPSPTGTSSPPADATPAPTNTSSPATSGGGGGVIAPATTSTVTFSGGFQ